MKNILFVVVAACALSAAAEARFYPTDLNVRDFGAKGDGVTDDTAAIQAASDKAAKCAEGRRIGVAGRNCKRACQADGPMPRLVFPAGTYLVTRPVFFQRDHQIYGFGGATVKAASPDIDVFVFVGTMRHFVTGLTMEGGARQFLVETHNNESANFKARDCVFRNASVTAVDSHSFRLMGGPDGKKTITVGTYRFDKEKGVWSKDERRNSPDLKPYNNSTYFSLERCAFYDCQRATDINPDGATFRDLKVVSSVTTGCVFRVCNNLHAYNLDVTLARPKGANDLAFVDYIGAHGLLLENSRFKSADDRGICLVHSSAKPSYIAHSLILRSLEVPCGGCPEGAIVQFRSRTTPEIVSVTDVNDVTERPVEAVSYADGMTAADLDAIRRFQQIPSDKTYSIAIGRNSPNVGDRLPPAVARYREPAADVPKAMTSLKVPPCPADGEVLWGPDFGLSEKASDDDTAAMKRLLEEAASRRLATVVLPPRRIVLKEPVTVSGEVTITAAGIALIEAADDCDIFRVESGSRVLLSHLFFRNGRHQLVCEASSDTTVVLDHCFSFDAADTAFVMTAEKGVRLKFLADGGVHYHPRWYEGNANAILAGAWLRTLPPKPYGEPFTESVNVINRGKLRFQDILGVPCVFSSIPKGSQAPAGDYRWIDNIGGELNAVFTRFGAEWGGIPPVYNFGGGKVLIEGSYAYFYPRYTAHAAVLTDREPAPGDIRLFGISCGMEVQLWYGGVQVLVRAKPEDEPKPVRSALRRCLVPKAEPCVTDARVADTGIPLYHWRFRDADTHSPVWEKTLAMLDRHPGAIDAVWFSTGIGIPSLDWHREQAKSLSRAADDLRRRGIEPSLQIQATIGHSDSACAKGPASVKRWGGWTGPDGTECELCSCPRQPEFRAYWESVARIYAEFHPPRIWIDDDLRPYGHAPASPWSASFSAATMGCWCSLCLGEFNREAGGSWTRETLREALGKSADLQAKWERFQFESIAGLAFAIAKAVHGVSPETEMGLQQCRHWNDSQRIVYGAMARATGNGVCARPGGGAYFDYSPIDQIEKAYSTCEQMRMLATVPNLSVVCPEIESFPRVFNSRTGQGVLLEALEAIPMGVNALSLLVANTRLEDVSFYERTYMDKLARNREFFLGLIAACRGAVPSGLVAEPDLYQKNQWAMTLGIPLVRGRCRELGQIELAKADVPRLSSSDLLALYRRADELSGGRLPAIPCEPVSGWLLPVQHEDGRLACVVFVNTRIDTSFPFRLRVRGVSPEATRATWRVLGGAEQDVPILRENDGVFACVPPVAAWNGGYLVF